MTQHPHNGPVLEVNLPAIARNYALLRLKLMGRECAAVVKADAYGLGVARVAPELYDAGCRVFFVATLAEGLALRPHLNRHTDIYVFHGLRKGEAKDFTHHHLLPVLNSLEQIEYWNDAGPCALHIDTGMNRLGLTPGEAQRLPPAACRPQLILSHLACANERENSMNRRQLDDFNAVRAYFPGVPASLANSSGIFLGEEYHCDMVRPGCALYGICAAPPPSNPMENVVTLTAPVLQYRTVEKAQSVGYGATAEVPAGTVLATVELGYADGFMRQLSNHTHGYAGDIRVPLVGRVSMDMVIADVSGVPEALRTDDLRITFIDNRQPVDVIAREAGTIGYEIFTRIGGRVKRVYA